MNWSRHPELYKTLLELQSKKYTQTLMASRLAVEFPDLFSSPPTRNMVKNALASAREQAKYLKNSPIADPTPYITKYKEYLTGDTLVQKNTETLNRILNKSKRKILVISDIHLPFVDEEKLQKAVDLNRTADMVVIAGDLLDGYSISRWRKELDVPFQQEIDHGLRFLEYLANTFPWVRIIHGNHDDRAMKMIRDALPPALLFLVDSDPLNFITRPFENVEYVDNWYTQIGDCVIAHQERSSSYEGRPAVLLSDFFETKGWQRRLGMDEIRTYITGHTHQVAATYKEDRKFIEVGCMAKIMNYALDSKAVMRPPLNGFVTLIQNDGLSDFNETREYIL